jgi:hypothetical protein
MAMSNILTDYHGVICFVFGLFCGTWIGVCLMCCMYYSRNDK